MVEAWRCRRAVRTVVDVATEMVLVIPPARVRSGHEHGGRHQNGHGHHGRAVQSRSGSVRRGCGGGHSTGMYDAEAGSCTFPGGITNWVDNVMRARGRWQEA